MIRISETTVFDTTTKHRELNSIKYFIDEIMNKDTEKVFIMSELIYALLGRFANDEVKARRTTVLK